MKIALQFVKAIDVLVENVNSPELNAYVVELVTALLERLRKGAQKDLKEVDAFGLAKLIHFLSKLLARYRVVESKDAAEEIEAAVLSANLRSENLLWKSSAIDAIKAKYALPALCIAFGYPLVQHTPYEIKEPKGEQLTNAVKLLKDVDIINLLFKEFPHPELIKKAPELIRLLVLCNEFTLANTQTIIACYKGTFTKPVESHEEVRIPLLNLFISMAEYAPYAVLELVFAEFKNTPLTAYTDTLLKALCFYTVSTLKNVHRRNQKASIAIKEFERQNKERKDYRKELSKDLFDSEFSLYDLEIIWNIATYSKADERISAKLKDLAISCLVKIAEASEIIAKKFVAIAFDAIASDAGYAIRSMKFLITCYNSLKKKWGLKKFYRAKLGAETINTLIINLTKYKEKVKASLETQKNLNNHMLYVHFNSTPISNLQIVGDMRKL